VHMFWYASMRVHVQVFIVTALSINNHSKLPQTTFSLRQRLCNITVVGMHEEAVDCHLRGGNPKAAVDCCVLLNRWDVALELAEKHDFPQVSVYRSPEN
jgi:hypothetical protein